MAEVWYHYECENGHNRMISHEPVPRQGEAGISQCIDCAIAGTEGVPVKILFKERVPDGYYNRSRERKLKCDRCGEVAELQIQNGVETLACTVPDCGGQMHVLVEGVPYLPVADLAMGESASRAAIDKWQKNRAEKQKIEERTLKEHGSL